MLPKAILRLILFFRYRHCSPRPQRIRPLESSKLPWPQIHPNQHPGGEWRATVPLSPSSPEVLALARGYALWHTPCDRPEPERVPSLNRFPSCSPSRVCWTCFSPLNRRLAQKLQGRLSYPRFPHVGPLALRLA